MPRGHINWTLALAVPPARALGFPNAGEIDSNKAAK